MNKNIYRTIRQEYEKRQKLALDNLAARRTEAYAKVPELQDIDRRINSSGFKYNRMALLNNQAAGNTLDKLSTEISLLKEKKANLLSEAGYPANYLNMSPMCPQCKDTGFIETEAESSLEKAVERCVCYKQQLLDHLYRQSNLLLTAKENFLSFDENYYSDIINEEKYGINTSPRENIMYIKENCLKFIENISDPKEKNLFFTGPTGTGKTFMANCIAREIMQKGMTVLYQTASTLFDTISEYKMKAFREENYENTGYDNIFDAELLIIDDLGTESPSASRYAVLLNILNTRQINNLAKPCKTIISTNIGIKKLYEYYDERIVSRIIGCFDLFRFAGDDIRSIKAMT